MQQGCHVTSIQMYLKNCILLHVFAVVIYLLAVLTYKNFCSWIIDTNGFQNCRTIICYLNIFILAKRL